MTDRTTSENPRFWLNWRYFRFGRKLDGFGCYRVGFKTQDERISTTVEVSEQTYREHYAEAFAWVARKGEKPPSPADYWDLPYDFHTSVSPQVRSSGISGWITFGGWRATDAEVCHWLLLDPRSILNPPTWQALALSATCTEVQS